MTFTMPFQDPDYQYGAPCWEAEEIDTEIASRIECPEHGRSCYYYPQHTEFSYIALAVCSKCDFVKAF